MATNPRGDRRYIEKALQLKRKASREGLPCHICGHPIDYTLAWPHPMSFAADHVEPLAAGGALLGELAPSHMSCNGRRGSRPLKPRNRGPLKTSREW